MHKDVEPPFSVSTVHGDVIRPGAVDDVPAPGSVGVTRRSRREA